MKRLGPALLMAGLWAVFGVIIWYFLLNGGVIGLRSDPKVFAIGGAVLGFTMYMLRVGEETNGRTKQE